MTTYLMGHCINIFINWGETMKSKILLLVIVALIVLSFGIAEVSAISSEESAANEILNNNNTDCDKERDSRVHFRFDNRNCNNTDPANNTYNSKYTNKLIHCFLLLIKP